MWTKQFSYCVCEDRDHEEVMKRTLRITSTRVARYFRIAGERDEQFIGYTRKEDCDHEEGCRDNNFELQENGMNNLSATRGRGTVILRGRVPT